jgi:hypothetical protein
VPREAGLRRPILPGLALHVEQRHQIARLARGDIGAGALGGNLLRLCEIGDVIGHD